MTRADALDVLRAAKPHLAECFGVTYLALFGSTARGTASETSDVDVMVSFDGPSSMDRYFDVQFFLEDALGRPVDLVTQKALRKEFRPYIERDLIDV